MGREEGKAQPNQTWSRLLGSAARVSGSAPRVIAVDEAHSKREQRLFCIGRGQRGIVTVRFTRRGDHFRIIGAGYWRKGKELYEKTNR
jgi:uncharacterized DUF497 family protein